MYFKNKTKLNDIDFNILKKNISKMSLNKSKPKMKLNIDFEDKMNDKTD